MEQKQKKKRNCGRLGKSRPEITAGRKKAFLAALAKSGNIGVACRESRVPRPTQNDWREKDPEFQAKFLEALNAAADGLEEEARIRAAVGWEEPVIHMGQVQYVRNPQTGELVLNDDFEPIILTIKKKSDRLLEVMLKAKRPEYRNSGMSLNLGGTGGEGQPVPKSITVTFVDSDGNGKPLEKPKE